MATTRDDRTDDGVPNDNICFCNTTLVHCRYSRRERLEYVLANWFNGISHITGGPLSRTAANASLPNVPTGLDSSWTMHFGWDFHRFQAGHYVNWKQKG